MNTRDRLIEIAAGKRTDVLFVHVIPTLTAIGFKETRAGFVFTITDVEKSYADLGTVSELAAVLFQT